MVIVNGGRGTRPLNGLVRFFVASVVSRKYLDQLAVSKNRQCSLSAVKLNRRHYTRGLFGGISCRIYHKKTEYAEISKKGFALFGGRGNN